MRNYLLKCVNAILALHWIDAFGALKRTQDVHCTNRIIFGFVQSQLFDLHLSPSSSSMSHWRLSQAKEISFMSRKLKVLLSLANTTFDFSPFNHRVHFLASKRSATNSSPYFSVSCFYFFFLASSNGLQLCINAQKCVSSFALLIPSHLCLFSLMPFGDIQDPCAMWRIEMRFFFSFSLCNCLHIHTNWISTISLLPLSFCKCSTRFCWNAQAERFRLANVFVFPARKPEGRSTHRESELRKQAAERKTKWHQNMKNAMPVLSYRNICYRPDFWWIASLLSDKMIEGCTIQLFTDIYSHFASSPFKKTVQGSSFFFFPFDK